MTVVAIGAHPDDVDIGCYGALAKLSEVHDIHIILFTAGELSADKEERLDEARESAGLIDGEVHYLGYPDGNVPVEPGSIDCLRILIEGVKAESVFTLYPGDTHQDHNAVSRITLAACKKATQIALLAFYEVPQTLRTFQPNYYVDITDYIDLKLRALKCFRSQAHKPFFQEDTVKGLAAYRGLNIYSTNRLFEAFEIHRFIT